MKITHNYAPWSRRAVAYILDNFVLIPFVLVFLVPDRFRLIALLAGFLFCTWSTIIHQGRTGQSMGRKATRTRLVDIHTGEPLGILRAYVRGWVHTIDFVPLCIGFLRPLWNEKRMTWADEVMSSVVVYEPKELSLEGWVELPAASPDVTEPDSDESTAA